MDYRKEDLMYYRIVVKDTEGKYFLNEKGNKVTSFTFTDTIKDIEVIESICRGLFSDYQAITGSSNINITVMLYSSFTETYPLYCSFYGNEDRFVKHT